MEHPQNQSRVGADRIAKSLGNTGGAAAVNMQCEKAMQEKRWHECSIEEKIERLRWETMHARDAALAAVRLGREAHQLAHDHSHGVDGRIYKPANDHRIHGGESSGRSFDPLA